MRKPAFIFLLFHTMFCIGQNRVFKTSIGKITFVSAAPKEKIKAQANTLRGVLDMRTRNFSFSVLMKNFNGFNNPLQKEHFYENYVETEEFPEATFKGNIIEPIPEGKKQILRAKGMMNIHGLANEMLIEVDMYLKGDVLSFSSKFNLILEDYNINIPRIVNQKISKTILVSVEGVLKTDK